MMKAYAALPMMMLCLNCYAGTPIFSVTPNVTGQSQLIQGQQGTYIFQITNNTLHTLTNIGLKNAPAGVSIVANAGYQYCSFPLSLNSQASCLVKLNINSNQTPNTVAGGPQFCFKPDQPVYCSQPLSVNQLATIITSGPLPTSCTANVSNFNYVLTQTYDSSTIDPSTIDSWGLTEIIYY